MIRTIVALTAILAGPCNGARASVPLVEDIRVPAGTVSLSRAIGLKTAPDPSRFMAEVARLTYGLPEGHQDRPSSTLNRLVSNLELAARFQTVVGALPDGGIRIDPGSVREDRGPLRAALDLLGLRLREKSGTYEVERTTDRGAVRRAEMLQDLGIPVDGLMAQLNRGEAALPRLGDDIVPVPLGAAWWSAAVFGRPVPTADLFAAIATNGRAALLCHGLAALDDETLEFVAEHRPLVDRLIAGTVAGFATFASSVKVRDGRVVPPGGDRAESLWAAVVGVPVTDPEAFIPALLSMADGRVAYLYDVLATLDAGRANFALGLTIADDHERLARFVSLVSTVTSSLAEWHVRDTPFARPVDDIAWILLNITVDDAGAPRGLVSKPLWSAIFDSNALDDPAADQLVRNIEHDDPIDAAWLAQAILQADPMARSVRLQQLAFGLRVFPSAAAEALPDVLTAVRASSGFPALTLTLERMRIGTPSTFAVAARGASKLMALGGADAYTALAQYQGSLGILAGMTLSGGLTPARADALVTTLSAVTFEGDGAGVAAWIRQELLPALPARNDADGAILAGLAGASATAGPALPRIEWEGERYRLDLAGAEERRLIALRARQRAFLVETALTLDGLAGTLGGASVDLDGVRDAVTALRALMPSLASASVSGRKVAVPPGREAFPEAPAVVDRAIKDLVKVTQTRDVRGVSRVGVALHELAAYGLADALTATAYAMQLRIPSEGAWLDADFSRRHDYGLGRRRDADRRSMPWQLPKQLVEPGVPRHVVGSLLGLEVAFASQTLRRVVLESSGEMPSLLSNDRDTFARSVSLMNPHALRDDDRDAIAAAIVRGRARVAAASANGLGMDALAEEIGLDGWRRRAAGWEMSRRTGRAEALFSLNELLALGHGAFGDLDAWGVANGPVSGCLCLRMPEAHDWRIVAGRPRLGAMGAVVPDLNLRVAVLLSELRLPAPLGRLVLGAVIQTFVNEVRPNDPADWFTLTRAAGAVTRERIEDYVAEAAAAGPLVPEGGAR